MNDIESGDRVRLEKAEGIVMQVRKSVGARKKYLVAEVAWNTGARSPVPTEWLTVIEEEKN